VQDSFLAYLLQLLLPDWVFRPSLRTVPNPQKKEPKRSVKQHAGLQSALEKFINVRADDPKQGEEFIQESVYIRKVITSAEQAVPTDVLLSISVQILGLIDTTHWQLHPPCPGGLGLLTLKPLGLCSMCGRLRRANLAATTATPTYSTNQGFSLCHWTIATCTHTLVTLFSLLCSHPTAQIVEHQIYPMLLLYR
jgi:hypothetical protein